MVRVGIVIVIVAVVVVIVRVTVLEKASETALIVDGTYFYGIVYKDIVFTLHSIWYV